MKTPEEALAYFAAQGDYSLDDDPDNGGFYFKYEVEEVSDNETELVLTFDHTNDDGNTGFSYSYRYPLNVPETR